MSGFRRRIHPEAQNELFEAMDYYQVRASMGAAFAHAAASAVNGILDSPDAWPPILDVDTGHTIRSHRISRFPYRVVYFREDQEVRTRLYPRKERINVLAQ